MPKRSSLVEPLLSLALCALSSTAAAAHEIGTSVLDAAVEGATLRVSIGVHAHALDLAVGADEDDDGALSDGELARSGAALEGYLRGRLAVTASGSPCPGRIDAVTRTRLGGAQIALLFECPAAIGALELDNRLFFEAAPRHVFIGTLRVAGEAFQLRFDADHQRLRHDAIASPGEVAELPEATTLSLVGSYLGIGVEHILGGIDHLLFILTLLIVARTLRDLAWLVTSFTLAHSLTLVLGALGLVTLPASFVEPAIALTILAVCAFNIVSRGERAHRPWLIFAFGLLHGFGFAGALAETGLPSQDLAWALGAFNVGVELGQLGVVLVLWPLVVIGSRHPEVWRRALVPASSALVGVLSIIWFVERV